MINFKIYRFNRETPSKVGYMQEYKISRSMINGNMILDGLIAIQEQLDSSLAFRRSCREGVCGSDGMNINGKNTLACIVPLANFPVDQPIIIRPLVGFPVIKDLIVDLTRFFEEYKRIKPYLQNEQPAPTTERIQSIEQRAKLDGLYECILCACCSSACPVYLNQAEDFIGPAAMLQAARFIEDSRDLNAAARIQQLEQIQSLFKCRNVLTCIDACPKGLDPNNAINQIQEKE